MLLLVDYSIRDHTNENISSVNLLLVTFWLYDGGWEKIFNVGYKYFDVVYKYFDVACKFKIS